MAFDQGLAAQLREDLAEHGPREQRMFGGLCFLLQGNMVCGVLGAGALWRVGAPNMAVALALPDVLPMTHAGRKMTGFVVADAEAMAEDATRARLRDMALGFVAGLPPK